MSDAGGSKPHGSLHYNQTFDAKIDESDYGFKTSVIVIVMAHKR